MQTCISVQTAKLRRGCFMDSYSGKRLSPNVQQALQTELSAGFHNFTSYIFAALHLPGMHVLSIGRGIQGDAPRDILGIVVVCAYCDTTPTHWLWSHVNWVSVVCKVRLGKPPLGPACAANLRDVALQHLATHAASKPKPNVLQSPLPAPGQSKLSESLKQSACNSTEGSGDAKPLARSTSTTSDDGVHGEYRWIGLYRCCERVFWADRPKVL